ncbi:unnamed protein product [Thelazia callipaeda]|uniref:TFIIIC_sub6 domain-containing protein n=1 Tax=Thelazia callipaeda TaxID=103827 RepID=A0A158RB61_THECL|nr:unnamed protein product [Thelazia callipaeda]
MGGLGCDNMTAILVCLLQEDTSEAYMMRCSREVIVSAAGDTVSLDSEPFVTPQLSPIRIESMEVSRYYFGLDGIFKAEPLFAELNSLGKLISVEQSEENSENEKPPREFLIELDKTKSTNEMNEFLDVNSYNFRVARSQKLRTSVDGKQLFVEIKHCVVISRHLLPGNHEDKDEDDI